MDLTKYKYPNIVIPPPGPKAQAILKRDEVIMSPSYLTFYPLVAESASGCIVRDVDGNEYIDFNSALVCMNVGHCHPKIVKAIKTQSEKLLHFSYTDFYYEPIIELGEKLCDLVPMKAPKRVYFGNSGAEAVEAAMKLTRWHTRKPRFMAYIGAFHGRLFGSMSLTSSKPVQRKYFSPLVPEVTHVFYPHCYRCPFKLEYPECDFWCVSYIDEYLFHKFLPPEEIAAFFAEPIQGEGGYIVPPADYFKRLKKLLDDYGILLVDDEVQSGMGRSGKWFAIEHFGVKPDVMCVAKAIASGLPLGAMVSRADLMDWEGGSHASTFGGNPVACAAALKVIEVIKEERLLNNALKQGEHVMKRLNELKEKSKIIGDVRGKGLMIGMELVKDKKTKEPHAKAAAEVYMRSWKRGIALISAGVSSIRIAPPLIITRDLVDSALDIIETAVREVEKEGI